MFANALKLEAEPKYGNIGQQAEREVRFTITGNWQNADNRKGGTDVLNAQIKSFRATLCHGSDINQILTEYAEADSFIFADREEQVFYTMTVEEFMQFARLFAEVDRESTKNGKEPKIRLNRQFKAQRSWLRSRT